MNQHARITSTDELKRLRLALVKFAEEGEAGLMDILSEINRVRSFIELESLERWRMEAKRRERAVAQARDELSRAEFAQRRTIEARRDLERAKRQFEEAKAKLEIIRRWRDTLSREIEPRLGAVRNLSDTFARIAPDAVAQIDRVLDQIDAYLSVAPPTAPTPAQGAADKEESMARTSEPMSAIPVAGNEGEFRERGVATEARERLPLLDLDLLYGEAAQTDRDDRIEPPPGVASASTPDGLLVVIDPAALHAADVILVRATDASPSDSGWTVSPLKRFTSDESFRRTTVGDLRRARPDWSRILSAPPGSLALISQGKLRRFELEPGGANLVGGRDAES